MKISLKADVKSPMLLQETMFVCREGQEYIFHRGEDGRLDSITIVSSVPDPSKFFTKFGVDQGSAIVLGTDREIIDTLRGELQDFEGLLALAFNLSKIGWDTARWETIAEGEEDAGQRTFAYQKTMKIPGGDPVEVPKEAFVRIVELRNRYTELRVPLSFWREGNNELRSLRFINAFFNFYFILEGLYANGKTAKREVEKQFLKSGELTTIITDALPAHLNVGRMPNPLQQLLAEVGEEVSVSGIVAMLIKVRGQLHHYSHHSSRRQGSPLSHSNYDAAAFFSGRMATDALRNRILDIDRRST